MSLIENVVNMKHEVSREPKHLASIRNCYHCGESVPDTLFLFVLIEGKKQEMCCTGCQAVATAIIDFGLGDFYKFRSKTANKPDELIPAQLQNFKAYDDTLVQEGLVETIGDKLKSTTLLLSDLTCPACVWLVESHLSDIQGVLHINVNYSTHRAQLEWDESSCHLSDILQAIAELGYKVRLYDISQGQQQLDEEQKQQLRRLGLAGVLSMQVMMLSIALYVGDWYGMDEKFRIFFSWLCLLLTTPVIFYSAQTFFVRAWRDLRLFRTGMDVPVSLGILIAYISSIWACVSGEGQIYYDSIVMFVFFLLTGRYFEFRARRRAALYVDNIGQLLPATATRFEKTIEGCEHEQVAVASLRVQDIVLVRPGELIPVDGILMDGATTVDESLLTGESRAVVKSKDDTLIAGSTNIEQVIKMRVLKIGKETLCSQIYQLLEKGQRLKPEILELSNRISAWFVASVLLVTSVSAWYWMSHNPALWVSITISVLIVSCPCALSLATPVAYAAAAARLMKEGVVLVNANVIEKLNKVTSFVFDKTGTLTEGKLKISKTIPLASLTEDQCLTLVRSIESNSLHPIARAFAKKAVNEKLTQVSNVINYPGEGLSAEVEGNQYFVGNEVFINKHTGLQLKQKITEANQKNILDGSYLLFTDKSEIYCLFLFQDTLRDGAKELMAYLKARGKSGCVLSGDNPATTYSLAEYLGLEKALANQRPDQKMNYIRLLQEQGECVAMIGDGSNDAPVLASADVSVSMGDGTALANANADLILLNGRLDKLIDVIELTVAGRKIIKQNLAWAILYNLMALPLAITGFLAPWMAAIGMSLSSIIVVINSGRLARIGK